MKATLAVIVSVAATLALAGSMAAATVPLRGTQTTIDEKKGQYEVQGSLLGKWQMTAFTERYATKSRYVGTGKERFSGCLDTNRSKTCDTGEPAGSLRFVFTYWASFNPATKAFVRGACVHPITGGTGAFAKATGIVHMTDVPAGKTIRTTYTGELSLAEATTTSSTGSQAERTLQSRAPAACGG